MSVSQADPALVGFQVPTNFAPAWNKGTGGPKALKLALDFSNLVTEINFNLLKAIQQNQIDFIQAMYVDNADNASTLVFNWDVTEQRIIIPAGAQGVFPIITPRQNPTCKITTSAGGAETRKIIKCLLLNVPMAYQIWGAIQTITVGATGLTLADASGAATGASVAVLPANAARNYLFIGNQPANGNVMYVNFGAAASAANGMAILPGGSLTMNAAGVSRQSVNIIGTNLETYVVKEG